MPLIHQKEGGLKVSLIAQIKNAQSVFPLKNIMVSVQAKLKMKNPIN